MSRDRSTRLTRERVISECREAGYENSCPMHVPRLADLDEADPDIREWGSAWVECRLCKQLRRQFRKQLYPEERNELLLDAWSYLAEDYLPRHKRRGVWLGDAVRKAHRFAAARANGVPTDLTLPPTVPVSNVDLSSGLIRAWERLRDRYVLSRLPEMAEDELTRDQLTAFQAKHLGVSRRAVAERLGVTYEKVRHLERKATDTLRHCRRVAEGEFLMLQPDAKLWIG